MAKTAQNVLMLLMALCLTSGKYDGMAAEAVVMEPADGMDDDRILNLFLLGDPLFERLMVFRTGVDESAFSMDIDEDSMRAVAHPDRVSWPVIRGLDLTVEIRAGSSATLKPADSESVEKQRLPADMVLEWIIRPTGKSFSPVAHFTAEVVGIRALDARSLDPVLEWTAPPDPPPCVASPGRNLPSCVVRGVSRSVRHLALSPDGRELLLTVGGLIPHVEMWKTDPVVRTRHFMLSPLEGSPGRAGFTLDGSMFVFSDGPGRIHTFSSPSGEKHSAITASRGPVYVLPGSMDLAASSTGNNDFVMWRMEDGTVETRIPSGAFGTGADAIAVSGNGEFAASLTYSDNSCVVSVWNIPGRRKITGFSLEEFMVSGIEFDYSGERLFLALESEGLRVVDMKNDREPGTGPGAVKIDCSAGIRRAQGNSGMLLCSGKRSLSIIDPSDSKVLYRLKLPEKAPSSGLKADVAMDAGIAAAVGSGVLYIWKLEKLPD